ncbi:MAG: MFS transporter [Ignavibacteriaceae bacterium]|nr:MFS transporter [Ignavibacteriaceae bacterium]
MSSITENISSRPDPPVMLRWTVLVMVSLAMFGNYYIYDSLSPVADLLKSQLNFSDSDIGLLQGIYSIPNIFMVLIGGIVIDKIGTVKSSFIFATLCLIGALVTIATDSFTIMATGRLIFGVGAESLIVAVTTALGRWFKGKELSFAFGLNLTIARLGTFAALNSPNWGSWMYESWRTPLLMAIIPGIICVVSVIVYWGLERHAVNNYAIKAPGKQDEINFKDIFSFSGSYWFIVLLCVVFYSAVFPFQTFAIKMMQEVHNIDRGSAAFLSSILTLASMILTPLFGLMSDFVGKRSLIMMIGSALLVPVYLMLVYTNISPFVPFSLLGIAFALIPAVMWPSVAIIVEEQKLGTAYGLMTLIQNIGLAGFNFLIGWVNDISGASASNVMGYAPGMWIFSSLGFFGMLFAFMLRRAELGPKGHGLEKGIRSKS